MLCVQYFFAQDNVEIFGETLPPFPVCVSVKKRGILPLSPSPPPGSHILSGVTSVDDDNNNNGNNNGGERERFF